MSKIARRATATTRAIWTGSVTKRCPVLEREVARIGECMERSVSLAPRWNRWPRRAAGRTCKPSAMVMMIVGARYLLPRPAGEERDSTFDPIVAVARQQPRLVQS